MADPILDNSKLLKSGNVNVPVNPSAVEAPARGAAAMGGAIKGIGDRGFQIAQQIQETKNAGTLAEMRRRMRETQAEFERDTLTQVDESQWLDEWNKRADKLGQEFEQDGLPPDVREQFTQQFNDFRSNAGLNIQKRALVQSLDRAKQRHLMGADQALLSGDIGAYEAEIDAIPGTTPEWKEQTKQAGREKHAYNRIKAMMFEDPAGVKASIEAGTLDDIMPEGDRRALGEKADVQISRLQTEEAEAIMKAYQDGDLETEADLKREILDSQYINQKDGEELIKAIRNTDPVRPEERADIKEEIRSLSDNRANLSATTYEKRYWELQKRLKLLGNRVGADKLRKQAGGISPENLVHLDGVQQQNHTDALTRKSDAVSSDKAKVHQFRPDINELRQDVEDNMEMWILTHPNASALTADEVKAKTEEMWDSVIEGGALEDILPPDPVSLPTDSQHTPGLPQQGQHTAASGDLLPPRR